MMQVFTDARIVKIGYETRDKVLWLQRDFGIYIVGLVDLDIVNHFFSAYY